VAISGDILVMSTEGNKPARQLFVGTLAKAFGASISVRMPYAKTEMEDQRFGRAWIQVTMQDAALSKSATQYLVLRLVNGDFVVSKISSLPFL
jgi:hypothetical protein